MVGQSRKQSAYQKAIQLQSEIGELREYIEICDNEIMKLAELYMDGRILEPVGKAQNKYQREINKCQRKINRNLQELERLRRLYMF